MLPGYHRTFAQHAGKNFLKRPVMPPFNTAIDAGEIHNSIGPGQDFSASAKTPKLEGIKSMDQLYQANIGRPLTEKDFPATFYLGNPL